MKFKLGFFCVCVFAICASGLGQPFVATLGDTSFVLRDGCVGENALPDGTNILIFHDANENGPDWSDSLAEVCPVPPLCVDGPVGSHNMNVFAMNGESLLGTPGLFYQETAFVSAGITPPHPVYYLRVCLPAIQWVSDTFRLETGAQEVMVTNWRCIPEPCANPCLPPIALTGLMASQGCRPVVLNWNPYSEPDVDSLFIVRDADLIGRVQRSATSYTDTSVHAGFPFYTIRARRLCAGGTIFSAMTGAAATPGDAVPVPHNVAASDGACGHVTVSWSYATNAGLDSFRIRCDGAVVGRLARLAVPGQMAFVHFTNSSQHSLYSVAGYSNACGESEAEADSGFAVPGSDAPSGVEATDGLCDSTVITWADVPSANGFKVYRYESDGSGRTLLTASPLPQNVHRYVTRSGTPDAVYRFTVSALNLCGEGPEAAYDTGFFRAIAHVTGVAASVDVYCTHVRISWQAGTNVTGYRILRNDSTLAQVGANQTFYNDSTASPGVSYSYRVQPLGDCGGLASDPVTGRRAEIAVVTGVAASVDVYCTHVRVSWQVVTNATGYRILRDDSTLAQVGANQTFYNDSTASPGVSYSYRVQPLGDCGGVQSNPVTGRRGAIAHVTGVAASIDEYCTHVQVSWQVGTNATGYRILRNNSAIAQVGENQTFYNDSTASPGVSYYYRVQPLSHCGGVTSDAVTGRRAAIAVVSGVAASFDVYCTHVRVSWLPGTNVTGYRVLRNDSTLAQVGADQTFYNDSTAVPGVSYAYRVLPLGNCNGIASSPVTGRRAAGPIQVQNLRTRALCGRVEITWNPLAGADSFQVRRDGLRLGSTNSGTGSFDDWSAVSGTVYMYTVVAFSPCGSVESQPVEGRVDSCTQGFLAEDIADQIMFFMMRDFLPPEFRADVHLAQSNSLGFIEQRDFSIVGNLSEPLILQTALNPNGTSGHTEMHEGDIQVISADVTIFADSGRTNRTLEFATTDTLVVHVNQNSGWYSYPEGDVPVLPDSLRFNTAFCASVSHGAFVIPILYPEPEPELIEVTVTNGCNPAETHCYDYGCTLIDWSQLVWVKRLHPDGTADLMTGLSRWTAPGCVCIWRSDFWLSVEMAGFEAVAQSQGIRIRFATASEHRNARFDLMRGLSADGPFERVAQLPSQGDASIVQHYAYDDVDVLAGTRYFYYPVSVDLDGRRVEHRDFIASARVEPAPVLPTKYGLTCYPNPFNSVTQIRFDVVHDGNVTLKVYNIKGQAVATLVNGKETAGVHTVSLNAEDLPSGLYFCSMQAGDFYTGTIKVLLVR